MLNTKIVTRLISNSFSFLHDLSTSDSWASLVYAVQVSGENVGDAVATAAAIATDGAWVSVVRMATETAVGACILLTVILFLRRDRERDKDIAARDRERDKTLRAITDGFREEVRTIVNRMESEQDNMVILTREVVTAVTQLNHTVQQLNNTVTTLAERQTKLEHHVFFPAPIAAVTTIRTEQVAQAKKPKSLETEGS